MKKQHLVIVSSVLSVLMFSTSAFAQLPSPCYGWNLGNTLEAPDGEGTWSPLATQSLINAVVDSGFNTIRLPVAWDTHANQSNHQIDAAWMARVKQVVDWCYARKVSRHRQLPLGQRMAGEEYHRHGGSDHQREDAVLLDADRDDVQKLR